MTSNWSTHPESRSVRIQVWWGSPLASLLWHISLCTWVWLAWNPPELRCTLAWLPRSWVGSRDVWWCLQELWLLCLGVKEKERKSKWQLELRSTMDEVVPQFCHCTNWWQTLLLFCKDWYFWCVHFSSWKNNSFLEQTYYWPGRSEGWLPRNKGGSEHSYLPMLNSHLALKRRGCTQHLN